MLVSSRSAIGCLFGISILGCSPGPTRAGSALPARSATASQDHAGDVARVFMAGIEAFNRHDLDVFVQQFAHDIQMYTPTGWLRGHDQVRQRFASTFADFPRVRMELTDLQTREVSPGMVTTDFRWKVFPMGAGPAFHGVGSGVYVLRDGNWVEVLEHETVTLVDEALRPPAK